MNIPSPPFSKAQDFLYLSAEYQARSTSNRDHPSGFVPAHQAYYLMMALSSRIPQSTLAREDGAQKLNLSEQHVRYLLAKGKLDGKRLGRDWVVLSLDYKRKRRPKQRRTE